MNYARHMNARLSPYSRPWLWLARETLIIAALLLVAMGLVALNFMSIPTLLVLTGLIGVLLFLTAGVIADIVAAGFCRWTAAMGRGLGLLVASVRYQRERK